SLCHFQGPIPPGPAAGRAIGWPGRTTPGEVSHSSCRPRSWGNGPASGPRTACRLHVRPVGRHSPIKGGGKGKKGTVTARYCGEQPPNRRNNPTSNNPKLFISKRMCPRPTDLLFAPPRVALFFFAPAAAGGYHAGAGERGVLTP